MREFHDWLREVHGPAQARRSAAKNAALFLQILKPGMRLLDLGCGPGSITRGLASAVAPAMAVGLDIDRAALTLDAESGGSEPRFVVADACTLPCPDDSFEAAFAHALLQHVESPLAVLREARRVLRMGSVIGLVDADFGSAVLHPDSPTLTRAGEILRKMRPNPDVGRRLRELLLEAGFSGVETSVVANSRRSPNETAVEGEFWARYFEAEPFIAHAATQCWSMPEEMLEIAAAWRKWGQTAGAFSSSFWCEAVGWV